MLFADIYINKDISGEERLDRNYSTTSEGIQKASSTDFASALHEVNIRAESPSLSFSEVLDAYVSGKPDSASDPAKSRSHPDSDSYSYDHERAAAGRAASPDMYVMSKVALEYGMNQINVGKVLGNSIIDNRRSSKN